MDIQLVSLEQIQHFVIIFARIAGFFSAIPVIFSEQAPVTIRASLIFVSSLLFFPILQPYVVHFDFSSITFFLLVINEILIGAMVALIARLIFTSVEFGGTVIGYQMGFAAANIFDPQTQRQTALISQFQNVFAILLFLSLDIHHYFIDITIYSYELLPPGKLNIAGAGIPYIFDLSSKMFVLGAKFSIPILMLLLLSGLILGVLSRTFPQLHVFMLSFPLNIGISLIVISLTLGIVKILLSREFDSLPDRIFTLLRYLN